MAEFKRISTLEAKALIDKGDVSIADVRDALSFNNGHISGASLLDNNNIGAFMTTNTKDLPLIIYCYHGNSSQSAAQYLAEQGFSEVYSMDGGFEQWRGEYPTVS